MYNNNRNLILVFKNHSWIWIISNESSSIQWISFYFPKKLNNQRVFLASLSIRNQDHHFEPNWNPYNANTTCNENHLGHKTMTTLIKFANRHAEIGCIIFLRRRMNEKMAWKRYWKDITHRSIREKPKIKSTGAQFVQKKIVWNVWSFFFFCSQSPTFTSRRKQHLSLFGKITN